MQHYLLSFFLGILTLLKLSYLPGKLFCLAILSITFLLKLFLKTKPTNHLLSYTLGLTWIILFTHYQLTFQVPKELEGKPVTIEGFIKSIPNPTTFGTQFNFKLTNFNNKKTHAIVRMLWHKAPNTLRLGQQWRLTVKLKRIHGLANPGSFNYEAYALQAGIRASGYVIDKHPQLLLKNNSHTYSINHLREILYEKISKTIPGSETSCWLTALTIGERHNIPEQAWEVLRNTGTNHLMAIAGLHIGLMATLAHVTVATIWRAIPMLALIIPATYPGATAALLMGLTYSAMAGFSLPTQRACLMLLLFLATLFLKRKTNATQVLSLALLSVLLINPLCVLTESFWLSFGSVALIIFGTSKRLSPSGLWWRWGRIQWVIAIGLLPLSIWLFQQFSLVAFLANSIAIPLVGFIVVPLCFFGSVMLFVWQAAGVLLFQIADKVLLFTWKILTGLAHLPDINWYQVMPNHWVLLLSMVGMLLMLLPRQTPGKYFASVCLLPLVLWRAPAPNDGEAKITLLDVGQGLSTVVRTHNHLLVFDTGAKLGNFDMGSSVLVPYLHTISANKVDMLVISHPDNDHVGGAEALLKNFTVKKIRSSVANVLPAATYCLRNEAWNWDGVGFRFIYPTKNELGLDNDSSCVLKIVAGNKTILLTGDIEKFAEKRLTSLGEAIKTDVLIAPHHGSKTSIEKNFVTHIHPQWVLFSTGYRNRYHFPHPTVIQQYQEIHSKMLNTVSTGAITIHLNQNPLQIHYYKFSHHNFWEIN